MTVFKLLACATLLMASACKAQPKWQRAETDRSLLWQVSGGKLKQPAYIFGTMHVLCPDDAKLSETMKQLIAEVTAIYFEIDMDDMVGMFGSLKSMQMRDGTKLADLLSLEDYERVSLYFSKHSKLPFSMVENYKPMLLSGMIAEQLMDCKASNGMEISILTEANKHKKPINGLETVEFQAALFDSIPYAKQAQSLVEAVDSVAQQKTMMKQMMVAYRTQDLEALEALTKAEKGGLEEAYLDLLLYNRNRNWVAKFADIASEKPVLIAVGAGHLPGSQGVLALLRKQGYNVIPIKN